jgi:hypothetical protein
MAQTDSDQLALVLGISGSMMDLLVLEPGHEINVPDWHGWLA